MYIMYKLQHFQVLFWIIFIFIFYALVSCTRHAKSILGYFNSERVSFIFNEVNATHFQRLLVLLCCTLCTCHTEYGMSIIVFIGFCMLLKTYHDCFLQNDLASSEESKFQGRENEDELKLVLL